jgi:hypothetical protein
MRRYGYKGNQEGYPLAAWIWGHRLRIGQHWMEYLLEFLNVLAGFDYELGQGINEGVDQQSSKLNYTRFTRLGLRRFVFYDEKEKTRHPYDDLARQLLIDELKETAFTGVESEDSQNTLASTRTLLKAFSAVEEQRSWFAKSLFPIHHNLLLWEALRKGATKYKSRSITEEPQPQDLDNEITYDSRNFFARGGEVYYLILSAGTQNTPERQQFIANRLRELLTNRNQAVGLIAEIINETWQQLANEDTESDNRSEDNKKGRLGWIPDPDCPFYTIISEDVATLLEANIDPLEILDLLTHLIGFHLTLYIYHRAHPDATEAVHANCTCLEICRLTLLIDALEDADEGIIRNVSAVLLREQQARIEKKGRDHIVQKAQTWVQGVTGAENIAHTLQSEARSHFNLGSKRNQDALQRKQDELIQQLRTGAVSVTEFIERYADELSDLLIGDFRKNFLGVHLKLAKSVGFVAPRKGSGARFVLGDNLLKALTLANLSPGTAVTYDEFLARIYQRYGLIVGPDDARLAGLFDRQPINAEYYDRNKTSLLEKMQYAGLAVAYSDATAMVTHANTL